MLAHFYIPRIENNKKLAIQKKHLGVRFCTEVLPLKRRHCDTLFIFEVENVKCNLSNFGQNFKPKSQIFIKKN